MEKAVLSIIGIITGIIGGRGLYSQSKKEGMALSLIGLLASTGVAIASYGKNEQLFYLSASTGLGMLAVGSRALFIKN